MFGIHTRTDSNTLKHTQILFSSSESSRNFDLSLKRKIHTYKQTTVNPSTNSISFENQKPELEAASFVAPNVTVAGRVEQERLIFYGAGSCQRRVRSNRSEL